MCTLKIVDLKERLREKNLSTLGRKDELVQRLLDTGVSLEELSGTAGDETHECEAVPSGSRRDEEGEQAIVPTVREVELLRRERDVSAREAELLRRELELLRMSPGVGDNPQTRTNVKKWQDVKELIGDYNGDNRDFDRWEKQMRKLLSSYHLDEQSTKALLCSRLSGKALQWYHSRADCVELSHEDLLRELKKMYGQRPNQLTLRRELEARKWMVGETFSAYLQDKVTLANRIPIPEEEMISYVIDGMQDRGLQRQARVQCYDSLDAMRIAFADVLPSEETGYRQRRESTVVGKDRPPPKDARKTKDAGSPRCFNCNEAGHFMSKCSKPRREKGSCYTCGKMGHRASQCSSPIEHVHCVMQQRSEDDDFRRTVELSVRDKDSIFNTTLEALLDSGSPISLIKERYIPSGYIYAVNDRNRFHGLNGTEVEIVGGVKGSIVFDREKHDVELRVVPDKTMQNSMILGRDFMKQVRISLSAEKEVLDIMNIELDECATKSTAQDMRINEDLAPEVKMHVDALSRQICVVEDNSFDRNLALCQADDPAITKIGAELERSENKLYEMRNGLVYRKRQGQILFYVPTALEASVIHKYHNEMSHVGTGKTVDNILNSYWFPDMKTKVDKHIRHCLKCVAFTPNSGKLEGQLNSIPKGDLPFVTVHIDHLAPLSRSQTSKYRYIFLVVDAFTKYVKLYPTKSTSTAEVIRCLESYFGHYSRPLRIVSDRGSSFTSREFEEFVKHHNILHIKISTASPQANGQVERVNHTILPMIAKVADEKNIRWYDTLREVEFACNNTLSKATNEWPSVLLFGVRQRGEVIDELRDALEANGKINVKHDLSDARKQAADRIRKNQHTNKRLYNRKRKIAKEYAIGDKVMIRNFNNSPGVSSKMIPRFKGPYQVDRVLRNNRYVLKDIEGFHLSQVPYCGTWEAANMRPWAPG